MENNQPIRKHVNDELIKKTKEQNKTAVYTLRLLSATIKDKDIMQKAKNDEKIDDAQIIQLIYRLIKQREETIEIHKAAKRNDQIEKEQAEIEILKKILPKQMNEQEANNVINKTLQELEVNSLADISKSINYLKAKYPGTMDFRKVAEIIKIKIKNILAEQ